MTDDDTLTGRLAALRRMIARGEQRSDALAMLDRIDALCAVAEEARITLAGLDVEAEGDLRNALDALRKARGAK